MSVRKRSGSGGRRALKEKVVAVVLLTVEVVEVVEIVEVQVEVHISRKKGGE